MPKVLLFLLGFYSMILGNEERVLPIFEDGKYFNPFPIDSSKIVKRPQRGFFGWFASKKNTTKPVDYLPYQKVDVERAFPKNKDSLYVTWIGHSSLLLQVDGVKFLIDPVFTNNVSPVSLVRISRFQKKAPVSADELPELDAVFISHDHYDHLNADAITSLEPKVSHFIMPKGVGQYFRMWKIPEEKIREYSWWEEGEIKGKSGQTLRFACTPAQHYSKRSLFEKNNALWSSWVFMGSAHKVFYSGDSGYNFHFKQIGEQYGPFDLTFIENGQYSVHWPQNHMFPEQSVQANLDLKGKVMIPVHWGSFDISIHDWWEPIERAVAEAKKQNVRLLTPKIGQTLVIDENTKTDNWWKEFIKRKE